MAADSDPTIRQRKPQKATTNETEAFPVLEQDAPLKKKVVDEDDYTPWVDVLRVITFLLLASAGLSYLVSNGESFLWNVKVPPKYLQVDWWQSHFRGPIYLTPAELAQYDGTDTTKPIYLAINGTIYDVSAGSRIYGPGGSYNVFAGVDASRGFVTGCFAADKTPDMRGVSDMFLPLDDPEVDKHWTAADLEKLKEQEQREAEKKVYDGLKHWVDFFGNSKKYTKVGYVKREPDWLEKEPVRPLCDQAAKGRKPRKVPQKEG